MACYRRGRIPKTEPPLFAGKHSGGSSSEDTLHQQGMNVLAYRCSAAKIKFWTGSSVKILLF
jgi:hypothetical protein